MTWASHLTKLLPCPELQAVLAWAPLAPSGLWAAPQGHDCRGEGGLWTTAEGRLWPLQRRDDVRRLTGQSDVRCLSH